MRLFWITGLDVPGWAAAGQENVQLEVDGQLRHEKGVSAPAIMTAHSWPELVREVQQLAGPVGGMVAPHICPYQESLWLAIICRSTFHLLSAISHFLYASEIGTSALPSVLHAYKGGHGSMERTLIVVMQTAAGLVQCPLYVRCQQVHAQLLQRQPRRCFRRAVGLEDRGPLSLRR